MRTLTKADACKGLKLSLSTLNRRIAAGEVAVHREPRGRRHRVYVMLDDDLPEDGEAHGPRPLNWSAPRSRYANLRQRWPQSKSSSITSNNATPGW